MAKATDVTAFLWSGANSVEERRKAATRLAQTIDESVSAAPEHTHFVIAHSHGGNVALQARHALSSDARNLHIITMATPFLSIKHRMLRISDRALAILISLGIIAILAYYVRLPTIGQGSANLVSYAVIIIVLSSIALGLGTLACSVYHRIRSKPTTERSRCMIPDPLRRINNQSLLVGGIILCVGLIYDVPFLELALFWLFPAIVLFFALRLLLEKYIYSHELETNIEDEKIPNLKILRCRFDEATISLLFGKMTSVMSRIAAFMSIILSLGAALLAIMLLGLLAQYTYSEYLTYERCLAQLGAMPNNGQCVIQGDIILIALSALLKAWGEYNVHFFILGFCACVAFIFVTAVFKSLFGRELLYRSLNAIVDVYDTPGGHDFYEVDWCVRSEARVFDLRHSLYTFPETAKKIAAYINEVSESKRHQV